MVIAGDRRRKVRCKREFTRQQSSEFVGISVNFLSLMEGGINAPLSEMLERIADVLKARVYDLFDFRT
jgi:transcriptional regulator with XRE-family HTH domain